jgi:hypothetical protein
MNASDKTPEEIISDLDYVQSALPEVLKDNPRVSQNSPMKLIRETAYPYSRIRVVEFQGASRDKRRLYLKRVSIPNRQPRIISKLIAREQAFLQKLNRLMPEESVKLITAFPEYCTMVTEECAGEALDSSIGSRIYSVFPSLNGSRNEQLFFQCGDWLRRFHATFRKEHSNLRPWYDYLSGEMIWRIKLLKKELPAHNDLLNVCNHRFSEDLGALETKGTSHIYHADFAPHNIFLNNDRLQVIDFFGIKRGHGILDIINFLFSIAPKLENPLRPKKQYKRFCRAFLSGYGSIDLPDPGVPDLILLLQSVKRLLVLASFANTGNLGRTFIARRNMNMHIAHLKLYASGDDMAIFQMYQQY